MFKRSLLSNFIMLLVLSACFDVYSEAKCHRHRRRRNNCCCGCKQEEKEGTTTPENDILSSVSGLSSPVSTSAVPMQSATTKTGSTVMTSEATKQTQSYSSSVVPVPSSSSTAEPSTNGSTNEATTSPNYTVQKTTATLNETTTTPNPRGTCTLFSAAVAEKCGVKVQSPCDPNCKVIKFDGDFGNFVQGEISNDPINDPIRRYKGCNPDIYDEGEGGDIVYRCAQMCQAADLYCITDTADANCFSRCKQFCHLPNNTISKIPMPMFCD